MNGDDFLLPQWGGLENTPGCGFYGGLGARFICRFISLVAHKIRYALQPYSLFAAGLAALFLIRV
ncbi:MAG: hypothetical protein ACTTJV_08000 [Ottowia sp.]